MANVCFATLLKGGGASVFTNTGNKI